MSKEKRESLPHPPFDTAEFPEASIVYLSETEKYALIMDYLHEHRLDTEPLLFRGFDGESLKNSGTFGDTDRTWAITQSEFLEAVKRADRLGGNETKSPLYYAFSGATLPALVVLKQDRFVPSDSASGDQELGWELVGDGSFDDSVVAVFFFP